MLKGLKNLCIACISYLSIATAMSFGMEAGKDMYHTYKNKQTKDSD